MLNARTAVGLAASFLFLISGCKEKPAEVKSGCYRLIDGRPLFSIKGERATFKIKGSLSAFWIGPWKDKNTGDLTMRPAFYLHDGHFGAPYGPSNMPVVEDKLKNGTLNYRIVNGISTIQVPVEAYGHEIVSLGRPC